MGKLQKSKIFDFVVVFSWLFVFSVSWKLQNPKSTTFQAEKWTGDKVTDKRAAKRTELTDLLLELSL